MGLGAVAAVLIGGIVLQCLHRSSYPLTWQTAWSPAHARSSRVQDGYRTGGRSATGCNSLS
jgi:hypothetical protein